MNFENRQIVSIHKNLIQRPKFSIRTRNAIGFLLTFVLNVVKEDPYSSQVIIITGYGSFESCREDELSGVYDFIGKPFRMADIHKPIKRAARKAKRKS
ncbi:MAG: hypothetical protein JSU85_04350 [Candidatus Zixiibacteriota bacterium]|nr:MAG: hypothetical protein JSU85_04350 [candidate division Zixibacteria bacterium]